VFGHEDRETLQQILKETRRMSSTADTLAAEIASLTAAVQAEQTVTQSAVTLINGFAAKLDAAVAAASAAGATPAQLTALSTLSSEIASSSTALAAAVSANTPPPPPAPAPAPVTP
jgi:hypothetical protein